MILLYFTYIQIRSRLYQSLKTHFNIHIMLFAELLPDILDKQPKAADGIDAVVVVDCVPIVGPDRLNKLKIVLSKIFSKFGKIHSDFYPKKDGKTLG